MTVDAESEGSNGARLNLSLNYRIALIGAISALLGAVFGVGGSVLVARMQFSENERSELRQERRAVYSEFLVAFEKFEADFEDRVEDPPDPEEVERVIATGKEQEDRFQRASVNMNLVASDRVRHRMIPLLSYRNDTHRLVSEDRLKGKAILDQRRPTQLRLLTDFIREVRQELNTSD